MDRARSEGQSAVEGLRRRLTERAAALINEHPEFARGAAEIGLVDPDWLADPTNHPIRTATSLDVVQRYLERSVEKEPGLIATLGLNAIQLLSLEAEEDREGSAQVATIVFTDLEGFTRFTSRSGDEAARRLLEEHHRAVGPVIRTRGGRIVKTIGDGLLLSFPAPEAAVMAALELHEGHGTPLRLRAGLHHGEVTLLGQDLIGHAVNVAARVADSARGGEVMATTDVRSAVGSMPGAEFGRARRRWYKGVDGSVLVCPVTRAD